MIICKELYIALMIDEKNCCSIEYFEITLYDTFNLI